MGILCPHCEEYIEPVLNVENDHIIIVCPVCKAELTQEDLDVEVYTQIIPKPRNEKL